MRKFLLTLITSAVFIPFIFSQDLIIKEKKGLISPSAYSEKISKDFNYLLLGENSPQQGISAVVDEKKTNIKISGLLYSGNKGVLSIEADLTSSNGIFFFDQEKGSEQGKITFNYYKKLYSYSEFYPEQSIDEVTSRLEILEMLHKAKSDYLGLRKLIKDLNLGDLLEKEEEDKAIKELKKLIASYINTQEVDGYNLLKPRKFNDKPYKLEKTGVKIKLKAISQQDKTKPKTDLDLDNSAKINASKVLVDYKSKRKTILKGLKDSIISTELKNADTQWAGNHILFLGISPFYERQGLKRFSYDNSKSFADMFTSEKGNVYGITLSLNYNLEKGEASKNKYKPENLFLRLSTSLGRASNFSNFKNSTLNLTTPLGNDLNGNPVIFTNSDTAFLGDSGFEYGFSSSFSLEAFYYPFKVPVGVFGRIGYENIRFNRGSTLDNIEMYPMRLGLLFSLKNKEKDKPILTIQTFVDRTDLNLDPSQPDNDLRFGIGIGLPINIR